MKKHIIVLVILFILLISVFMMPNTLIKETKVLEARFIDLTKNKLILDNNNKKYELDIDNNTKIYVSSKEERLIDIKDLLYNQIFKINYTNIKKVNNKTKITDVSRIELIIEDVSIIVYLDTNLSSNEIDKIKDDILRIDHIKDIEYKNNDNSLKDTIEVYVDNTEHLTQVAKRLENMNGVNKIYYFSE